MENLLIFIKSALKWYIIVLCFWMVILGGQAIASLIVNRQVPDNGIFDCRNGVYLSGEAITINATPNISTAEIIESFEECLYWHILESEVGDE